MSGRIARFYKDVGVAQTPGGFVVLLDGKPVHTPAKAEMLLPNETLANALAGEWRAQTVRVDPGVMPLTRLANTAIDRIGGAREAVIAEIAAFGRTDVICYRADVPADLAAHQARTWDPLLEWAERRYGARLNCTRGVRFVEQPAEAIAALERAVAAYGNFGLAALHTAVTLTHSLVTALALAEGRLNARAAYAAAHADETYQADRWGHDNEAAARAHARERELGAAALVLESLRKSGGS